MPRNTADYNDRSNQYQQEDAEQYSVGPVLERDEWRPKLGFTHNLEKV